MDIHAPEGPTRSFREFAIHILIVTIGILIALGLEGLREVIHDRHQVRETRELLHDEIRENQLQLTHERARTQETLQRLGALLQHYDELKQDPAKLRATVEAIDPSTYFVTSLTWETALSTGVLGHMTPDEVMREAAVSIGVKTYSGYQADAFREWNGIQAFFQSRTTYNSAELTDGRERLERLQQDYKVLDHLQMELGTTLERASQ